MSTSIKSQINLKLGQVGSKTRSLGQILQKPSVRSRGNIFCPILMNVFLNNISDEFENGSCRVKS